MSAAEEPHLITTNTPILTINTHTIEAAANSCFEKNKAKRQITLYLQYIFFLSETQNFAFCDICKPERTINAWCLPL